MSRDGSGIYTKPFPDVVTNTPVSSAMFNGTVNDMVVDANTARPVVAGGTGAVNADAALFNLAAEKAAQLVTNYDTHLFVPGSFYSATTATGEPVDGQAFSGVAYISEPLADPPTNANVLLEARSATDERVWIRRKTTGVWGAWALDTAATSAAIALKVAKAGDTMSGNLVISKASPALVLSKPAAGTDVVIQSQTGANARWTIAPGDSAVEGGANAGSNFSINAFNDAGAYLSTPLSINRATGLMVVAGDPAAALGVVTKQYADAITTAFIAADTALSNLKVAKGGDTMTGLLVLSANPTAALGAATKQYVDLGDVLRSYLAGLTLSTAGSSATFGIAAGVAADSTNVSLMTLASAYTKTTSGWAVGSGNGAMDTGSVANSTWYHVHLIKRLDTGVVDVLFSLSPTAPTLPANYTLFRRIGSMTTDGSAQWRKFIQNGDDFNWDVAINDANNSATSTTATLLTLSVPSGIIVNADLFAEWFASGSSGGLLLYDPARSTQVANTPAGNVSVLASITSSFDGSPVRVLTDTSSRIRYVSTVAGNMFVVTRGWTDTRGRLN